MSEFFPSSYEDRGLSLNEIRKINYSYDEIHELVRYGFNLVQDNGFKPDYIIAIGGGGFIPARILRTYIDVPILAFSASYYEGDTMVPSKEPKLIQTIDPSIIIGKKILIVDEVDDTRNTLLWVINKINTSMEDLDNEEMLNQTQMGVFVVHNKDKKKVGFLDDSIHYFSCEMTPGNAWIVYPWDIE